MIGILTAFAIIIVVIATGYLLDRYNIIDGESNRAVINRVVFYAALPALMFSEVSQTDLDDILSPVMAVFLVATLLTGLLYCVISLVCLRRDFPTTTAGAGASLYVNAVNIGLPVMIYVLGHAYFMAPIVILQAVILNPLLLSGLAAGGASAKQHLQRSLLTPLTLATAAGLMFTVNSWSVPEPVLAPFSLLGGAAVPLVLLSFGASLSATKVLQIPQDRPSIITASVMKLVGMPAIAWTLGLMWGLDSQDLYAVVILATLPSAQNVYNFAATYGKGIVVARDTVFITTFAALPVMLTIALLFGR